MKTKFLIATAAVLVLLGSLLLKDSPSTVPGRSAVESRSSEPKRAVAVRSLSPAASGVTDSATDPVTPEPDETALFRRIFGTKGIPELKPEQLETYLKENHRSAQSLLVAERATGDKSFLREAMEKFPNDPHVAFEAYFRGVSYDRDKAAPEEARKWLDALRQADPNNALGDYLSARDHFRSGQKELALQELQAASGKSGFDDYSLDFLQASEEAYRAAGYSELQAKWVSSMNLLLPTLSELKQLALNTADLAKQYQQAGDTASAQAVLQMGLGLADRCYGPDQWPLINTLVGVAIDRIMLGAMDPNSAYANSGQPGWTVQNQIDALNQQRQSFKVLVRQSDAILPMMSDQDLIAYRDRQRMFGEPAAMRWALDKYSPR